MTLPDQDLLHGMPFILADLVGLVGILLVIDKLAAPIVAIYGDQHPALGVHGTVSASIGRKTAEHYRMDNSEAGQGQHGDGQLSGHRQMQGCPVTGLQTTEIFEQGRHLVYPDI